MAVAMSCYATMSHAQEETIVIDSLSGPSVKTVIAGDYDRSAFHNFVFGKHYRQVWSTPVKVNVLMLDTAAGGLKPYTGGGGRQSKTLRLHDGNKREYVLRSVDKNYGRALPEVYDNSFVESIFNDQVSSMHPYAAFTIPQMAEAAAIYHTNPRLGYVPGQAALDSFNEDYANRLYLLEQRPDEDWSPANNLGNSKNIVGTEKLLENLAEDNDNIVDQEMYIRARLFDMFIGDWGRHEDQWRWASSKQNGKTIYRPIPRDRDQTYSRFDGALTKLLLSLAKMGHLESFSGDIKNVKEYNFAARYIDRRCANETTLDQWLAIANDLQQAMSDEVIDKAVKEMPPEAYAVSGQEIAANLKSRRQQLPRFAEEYYRFLARHVDIPGSEKREYFDVQRLNDELTSVNVYKITKKGKKESQPIYSRTFKTSETKDIRVYGIDGNDIFNVTGEAGKGIKVRIIGGDDRDSIIDRSHVANGHKRTRVYDDENNYFSVSRETKLKLGNDSAIHAYDYKEFGYHDKGLKPTAFYNNPDRIYVGIGYGFERHIWRKYPYGFDQAVSLRYSISQNAFSILYEGEFKQFLGSWDMNVSANFDAIRWTNYFGLGNETKNVVDDRNYYRMRTEELLGTVTVSRNIGRHHHVDVSGFGQMLEIINDPGRFVAQHYAPNELYYFKHHKYAGTRLGYTFQDVNNVVLPTKGIMLYGGAAFTQNLEFTKKNFFTYNAIGHIFVPLISKFSLSSRSGVTTVSGNPEFFQHASVGGSQTIRGFRRDRFWGQTAFYNTNELRWITDLHSYTMNGKIGVVGLLDNGRVWMPGENSDRWHLAWGGGILLSPFNMITASLTYAVAEEGGRMHFRIYKLLQ